MYSGKQIKIKMNEDNKIRVSEFAKISGVNVKMLYYFISVGKIDVVVEYGLKLVVMNERANNFLRQYKKWIYFLYIAWILSRL